MSGGGILGGFKMFTGIMGARNQAGLDRASVEMGYQDNLEKIRRRTFTQNQQVGLTKALTESSGVRHTGGSTAQGYINTMTSEFDKEIKYMQKYALTARRLGNQQASLNFSGSAIDSFFSGIGMMGS